MYVILYVNSLVMLGVFYAFHYDVGIKKELWRKNESLTKKVKVNGSNISNTNDNCYNKL